jgi:hypothetical protein
MTTEREELSKKISDLSNSLEQAKLELDAIDKEDFREECNNYLTEEIQRQSILEEELKLNLTEGLKEIKEVINRLLSNDEDDKVTDFGLAKTYMSGLKDRLNNISEKVSELKSLIQSTKNFIKIVGQSK